jgi:class 3 adenylate cyclase
MAAESVEHELAAILSADGVGYSGLMAEDEAATIRRLTDYREQITVLARQHRGRVVDAPGDNVRAEFMRGTPPEALAAVERAIELNPSFEVLHGLRGMTLAQQGRVVEATRSGRRWSCSRGWSGSRAPKSSRSIRTCSARPV